MEIFLVYHGAPFVLDVKSSTVFRMEGHTRIEITDPRSMARILCSSSITTPSEATKLALSLKAQGVRCAESSKEGG